MYCHFQVSNEYVATRESRLGALKGNSRSTRRQLIIPIMISPYKLCEQTAPSQLQTQSQRQANEQTESHTHTRAPSQASLRRSKRYYHAVRSRGGSTTSALINFCDVFQSLNKSFVGRRVIETRTQPRGADQPGAEANRTPGTNGGMQGRAGVLSRPAPLRRWSIGETQDNANQL